MPTPPGTRYLRVYVTLAALVSIGRPAMGQQPPAADRQADTRPVDTLALAREVPRLIRASAVPGLSMAVVQRGRVVWTGAFGTVNDSAKTPLDAGTVFEAASLSKPVFAYLVLRLAGRGEFDLDRPLYELLDYPRVVHDERYKQITARVVLSHGSGLPNWGGETMTSRFDPGSAYGYSGEGFVFLQKTLEHVTGRSLEELARRDVFEPLGMTRSSFVWQDRFAGDVAYARDWLWHNAPVNRYVEANAAYTLLTTAADYGRFVGALLAGRGLSPAMWKSFLAPVRETSPGISIGLGIRLEDGPDGRIFYHSGNNGRRFTGYMMGDIEKGRGLVYFASAANGTSLVRALSSRVFGNGYSPRHWSDFYRSDDPHLLAVRSVERAAVAGGGDAARNRIREIAANPATRPSLEDTWELGAFLAGRGLTALSIEILENAVADAPDSAAAHLALGGAFESAGDFQKAIESYRRADSLEGGSGDAPRRIEWAQARLAARERPVSVSQRTLKRYEGLYQERGITLREGRLYYRRGANPESPLTPMTEDLFEIEANPSLRVRFVTRGQEPADQLVEIDSDGTIDESTRSPGTAP
ncbi:MAG TPA: serine hydrolase [Gemmatimonadales bacterium]